MRARLHPPTITTLTTVTAITAATPPAGSVRHRRVRWIAACCLTAATLTGAAACSDTRGGDSTAASGAAARADNGVAPNVPNAPNAAGAQNLPGAAPYAGKGGVAAPPSGAPDSAKPAPPPATVPGAAAAAGRSLVFTATLTVRTGDVSGAVHAAEQLAVADGGFVGDEKADSGTVPDVPGITQASVTLRVPSAKFDEVLGRLGTGGTVLAQTRSASDVTAQVVDTGSRITSAQASIARITDLMKNAGGLSDVVALEGELSRRQADLDSLKSQLAALQDQVSLSTITVTYQVPQAVPAAPAPPKKQNAVQRGLHDGWTAFVGVVKVLLIVFGAVLPFAVLAALLWWPLLWVRRRVTRGRPAVPITPTAPAVSAVSSPAVSSTGTGEPPHPTA